MTQLSVLSQETRCFNKTQLDSIYLGLILANEAHTLRIALHESNKTKASLSAQISILEYNVKDYQKIIHKDSIMYKNMESLYKAQRKKKWGYLLKGATIGAGGVLLYQTLK